MADIYSILGISQETLCNFSLLSKTVADDQTQKVIDRNCRKLKGIEDCNLVDGLVPVTRESVASVIKKVLTFPYNIVDWSLHELRTISYSLLSFYNYESAFAYAVNILERNWRDTFFNGVTFCLLSSWNTFTDKQRAMIRTLLKIKLNEYSGHNKRYLSLREYFDFLQDEGPLRMTTLLDERKVDIDNAPALLGYRPSTVSWSYYSDVIIEYIRKKGITDLSTIESLLGKNSLDRTKKLVVVYLVEKAKEEGVVFQDAVSKFTNRIIGDISINATWAPFQGATDEEKASLDKAKEIMRKWFARKIIEVFFSVCVQDYERKMYWTKYIDYIKDFRLVGSYLVRRKLETNNMIESYSLKNVFIPLNSKRLKTAALIMYIKDWIMVEFSDTGCLYVYEKDHPIADTLNKTYINSINDLKLLGYQLVFKDNDGYYYVRQQGRHFHKGDWQWRLDLWMRDKFIIAF